MSDLTERIEEVAAKPKTAQADQTRVDQVDLADLIEADRYLAGRTAADVPTRRGLRFNKITPPGAA